MFTHYSLDRSNAIAFRKSNQELAVEKGAQMNTNWRFSKWCESNTKRLQMHEIFYDLDDSSSRKTIPFQWIYWFGRIFCSHCVCLCFFFTGIIKPTSFDTAMVFGLQWRCLQFLSCFTFLCNLSSLLCLRMLQHVVQVFALKRAHAFRHIILFITSSYSSPSEYWTRKGKNWSLNARKTTTECWMM